MEDLVPHIIPAPTLNGISLIYTSKICEPGHAVLTKLQERKRTTLEGPPVEQCSAQLYENRSVARDGHKHTAP